MLGLPGPSHGLNRTLLSGAAKHYEEVFILTLRKIDTFLKDKAEVNWDFLKRFRGRSNFVVRSALILMMDHPRDGPSVEPYC